MEYSLPISMLFYHDNKLNLKFGNNESFDFDLFHMNLLLTKNQYDKFNSIIKKFGYVVQGGRLHIEIDRFIFAKVHIIDFHNRVRALEFNIPSWLRPIIMNPNNFVPDCLVNYSTHDEALLKLHIKLVPNPKYLKIFPWITHCTKNYRMAHLGHQIYYGDLCVGCIMFKT